MSYILDALKKSSEERRRRQEEDEQRNPLPLNSPVKQEVPGQYRWRMVLLLVFILVFSAVGLWFLSISGKGDSTVSHPEATLPSDPQQGPELKATDVPRAVSPETVEPFTTEQTVAPETKMSATGKRLEKPVNVNSESKLPLMEELPLAIQAQLPEMKFSGHVFSPNPELRMIMINTSVVREGDLIDGDLRLMEITRDGLTMSHKGTDFKVVLF